MQGAGHVAREDNARDRSAYKNALADEKHQLSTSIFLKDCNTAVDKKASLQALLLQKHITYRWIRRRLFGEVDEKHLDEMVDEHGEFRAGLRRHGCSLPNR